MVKKRLSLNQIKKIELDILIYFDKYCCEHGLRYYLAGGTLLGAIRHRGFIPWDDDIDVCMPRADYEYLISNFDEYKNFKLLTYCSGTIDRPFLRLVNKDTIVEWSYFDNKLDNNIWIDIFPVDGLPNDYNEVKKIYKTCDVYRKVLVLTDVKLGEGKSIVKKYAKYILKPLANIYGKHRCINNIEKIAAQYPYNESNYVGIVTWGLYGAGERMPKSEFEKPIEVEFEGYKFPAFSCWDSYLKGLYGDYMQLPPVEKRKTHDMVAYLVEED